MYTVWFLPDIRVNLLSRVKHLRTKINDSAHNSSIVRQGYTLKDSMEIDIMARSKKYQSKVFSLLSSCNYKYGDNLDALLESMIYLSQLANLRVVYDTAEDGVVSTIEFSIASSYGVEAVDIAKINFYIGAYAVRGDYDRVLKSGTYSYDQSKPVFERLRFIELLKSSV